MPKYTVQQYGVDILLGWVRGGNIAIPEMQRPFVWNSTKVRDLLDSLYQGFPIGYIITWQSPGAALKHGQVATFQQILIDGQQRITAMTAALEGQEVVDKRYRKVRVRIAFNPVTEVFETATPIIRRDPEWIADVSEAFKTTSSFTFLRTYLERNPGVDAELIERNLQRLLSVRNASVGVITLAEDLDVETVSEIFIRINSKGVPLSSADFAMSKIASYGEYGSNLRKLIDYFCHLSVAPHVYSDIEQNDPAFASTKYFGKIAWLRHESEDLYDPSYGDVIRVATLAGFGRGRPAALVSYLSGRDFETRTFAEELAENSFGRLEATLLEIVNSYNFQQFTMTIKSAGFIEASMIVSKNALNFAYGLYLRLRQDHAIPEGERKRIVRKWFVLSMLTNRHSGSFESTFEQDIRRIEAHGAAEYLKRLESSELGDNFWEVSLPQDSLVTSSTQSPYFQTFIAAQIKAGSRGFLSKSITVRAMKEHSGDIHHLVPKDLLIKNGYEDRSEYNQVANLAVTETPVNIAISNRAPVEYMRDVRHQCETGILKLGEITNLDDVDRNLAENAVPRSIFTASSSSYLGFLAERRVLMARLMREYYTSL